MTVRTKIAAVALAAAPMLLLTGCSKPEPAELNSALVKLLTTQSKLDEATAKKVADCATPKLEDQLSASSLNNIVDDGIDAKGSEKDTAAAEKILKDCATSIGGGS